MWLLLACGGPAIEGTEAGECSDKADNDSDGQFDCDDPDCSGSSDCTDPGTTPTSSPTTLPGPPCAMPGTYVITTAHCGVADLANPPTNFFEHYTDIRFTAVDAGRGECAATLEMTGPTCSATEPWTLRGSAELGTIDIRSDGVDDCTPTGCAFVNGLQPCVDGAGQADEFSSFYAEDLGNGAIRLHGWGDHLFECDLGFISEWQLQ